MMNTMTREGVLWGLTAPGHVHYSTRRAGGHLFLHARKECSLLADPVVEVSPRIVQTLWEKDVATSSSKGENDVEWCEECATKKVDPAP